MEKKSFLLYFDAYPSVALLPPEQRGELLSVLFEYAMAEAEAPTDLEALLVRHPDLSPDARMAAYFMARTICRDTEKWREKQLRYQKAAQRRVQEEKKTDEAWKYL